MIRADRRSAASAAPAAWPPEATRSVEAEATPDPGSSVEPAQRQRRAARIVQLPRASADERELSRRKLLTRLMGCEGRGAITRAANEYLGAGFALPEEQEVQLQLLEHFDEARAREAIEVLRRLLPKEPPVKKPVLEQRLRRLEDHADEPVTRVMASELRRSLRT